MKQVLTQKTARDLCRDQGVAMRVDVPRQRLNLTGPQEPVGAVKAALAEWFATLPRPQRVAEAKQGETKAAGAGGAGAAGPAAAAAAPSPSECMMCLCEPAPGAGYSLQVCGHVACQACLAAFIGDAAESYGARGKLTLVGSRSASGCLWLMCAELAC